MRAGVLGAIALSVLVLAAPAAAQPSGAQLTGAQLRSLQRYKAEAETEYRAGRLEPAIRYWEMAYGIEPDPVLLASIGVSYLGLGQAGRALGYFERVLDHRPPLPEPERPTVEAHLGRALAAAEKLVAQQPPSLLLDIGRGHDRLGRPEQALDDFEQYLRQEPAPPLEEKHRLERYLTDAGAHLAMLPPTPARRLRLGRAYERLGRPEDALRLYMDAAQGELPVADRALLPRYVEELCARLGPPCEPDFAGHPDPRLMEFLGDRAMQQQRARRAVDFYQRYLAEVAPSEATAAGRQRVTGLRDAACRALRLSLVEPRGLPEACQEPPPGPGTGLVVRKRPVYRSPWLWAGVGLLVAGAAAAAIAVPLTRVEPPAGEIIPVR